MKAKLSIAGLLLIIIVCFTITFKNLAPVEDDGYRSARERALIKKFDKDGDGKLGKEEMKAVAQAEAERRQAWIKEFDTDGDGEISQQEKEAMEIKMIKSKKERGKGEKKRVDEKGKASRLIEK